MEQLAMPLSFRPSLTDHFVLLPFVKPRDKLQKNGFPPEFSEEESSSVTSSFLRIGSIDLSGTVIASLQSRPLKKEITSIKFDLDTLDPLDRDIKNQSMENLATLGRRGCTTEELYSLIQKYFGRMLRETLSDVLEDLAADGGKGKMEEVNRVVNLTKDSIAKYVDDAGDWTGEQVQKKLAEQLDEWGKSIDNLSDRQKSLLKFARRFGESKITDETLREEYKSVPSIQREPRDQYATDPGV
jgi:hypothetical protein